MSILDEIPRRDVVIVVDSHAYIGQVTEEDFKALEQPTKSYITLLNPAEVHMQMDRNGAINFAMIPYMMYREGEGTRMNSEHISGWATPNEDMRKAYGANILGHKVVTPPEKKLLLS